MTIHERFPFVWKERKTQAVKRTINVNDILNEDIEVLNLKARSKNALRRRSINTIEDLIKVKDELSRIRNVGENSVFEIKVKLLDYLKQATGRR